MLAGPTWRNPWSVLAPLRGTEPARLVRVALLVDQASHGTAKQVQEGGQRLVDAGYTVDEAEPPSIDVVAKTLLRLCG